MSHVDIAMATYNGEAYIEEQIISILNQTYHDWTLYISDDASTDRTIEIITKYSKIDARVKLINTARQGGVIRNFNKALEATNSDYVLLSDQDDVWFPNRLAMLLEEMHKVEISKNKPIMIFSDLELVDKNLIVTAQSFYESNGIDPRENLNVFNLVWGSSVYGCSTILNRCLLNKCLPIPPSVPMHDCWLALNSVTELGLHYYEQKTIKYRQHENNVVGGSNKTFIKKLKNAFKTFSKALVLIEKSRFMLREAKLIKNNESLDAIQLEGVGKILFCFSRIAPKILNGNKKIFAIFMFIGILIK
jgi:rhamnosyltransferase